MMMMAYIIVFYTYVVCNKLYNDCGDVIIIWKMMTPVACTCIKQRQAWAM